MPVRKKVLYYGFMLFLTLLAWEGMARMAYLAAYGQGYGRGGLAAPANYRLPKDTAGNFEPWMIRHPFYGFIPRQPDHALNHAPPRPRPADRAVIGLLGGSVADEVAPFLQDALNRYFAVNNLPRPPVVHNLTLRGAKQPQQAMILADLLLRGGQFDLIINLDGRNEMVLTAHQGLGRGVFPFFPNGWPNRVGLTSAELSLAGQIGVLRREQERLAAAGSTSPWRWSAVFGLANRYRRERIQAEISRLNHKLAAAESDYSLEKHGPGNWPAAERELLPAAARLWYRSSVTLARLAEIGGADYYHFLQPNQYVPGAKPFTPEELEIAYALSSTDLPFVVKGYPLLSLFERELQSQGVNFFDLTGIFAANRETLYRDECCHLNDRGNQLLAAAMVRRLEPALQRLGRAQPDSINPPENAPPWRPRPDAAPGPPLSPLAAAWRPAGPGPRLIDSDFQVYHQAEQGRLWYIRDNCAPAEVEPRFFLHLTPRDLADLPPERREHGFDNRDFSFAAAEGFFWRERCMLPVQLPDYPMAYIRTGQYVPEAGELWAGDYSFPE